MKQAVQFCILPCDNAVFMVWLELAKKLPKGCGLKYLFWSSRGWLEMSQGILKKTLLLCSACIGTKTIWLWLENDLVLTYQIPSLVTINRARVALKISGSVTLTKVKTQSQTMVIG